MKDKMFILTLLAVFAISAAVVLSGWMQGDELALFLCIVSGNVINLVAYILILYVIVILYMDGLNRVIKGLGGCYDHCLTRTLLISALFTLGFNLIGLTNAILTKTPINKNVVGATCVALTVTAAAYIVFTVLIIKRPVTDPKTEKSHQKHY